MTGAKGGNQPHESVEYVLSSRAVRERATQMFELAERGQLEHFELREDRLRDAARLVADVTRKSYPDLQIPYHSRWRHFGAAGVDRVAQLEATLAALGTNERALAEFDLVITSVLLDAGAGDAWRYVETSSGKTTSRSEGLAVASFHMFTSGLFSGANDDVLRADGTKLQTLTSAELANGFQVRQDNPLVGLEGRLRLLQALGRAVSRPGDLFDAILARSVDRSVRASDVLRVVLTKLGPIWPGRIELFGTNLGDVWRHSKISGQAGTEELVPFHKLSQWLTYSLLEPLERAGLTVTHLDELTGLAEYRNGGLFVDTEVLVPKHKAVLVDVHLPSSEVIVEWRALTVALLDRIAPLVRELLGVSAQGFPLAKILEGGTWAAGRVIAAQKRTAGGPPIRIASDATVF